MDIRAPHPFDIAPSARERLSSRRRRAIGRWLVVMGAVALLPAIALAWYFLKPKSSPETAPPPPVTIAQVTVRNITALEHSVGTVVAVSTVSVSSQVSGQLMSAGFQEGQIVHTGDILFQIDPRPFTAALQQAQAQLARDEAGAANAERDRSRYIALHAEGAASTQLRDQAVTTADADAAIVKSDRAAVVVAQLNLGYATIRSPITGKTGPILVQPGNLIAANNSTSPLVTITQIQPIKVSVSLPQSDLPRLTQQMHDRKLTALVNLHNGPAATAPVTFMGNQVDARTGTIELRATFPNTDGRLVPGQLVDVGVTMNQYRNAMTVPHDAVNLGPAGQYVYVIAKDGTAQLHAVTALYDDGAMAAITGDVKPGNTVIVQGQLRVIPGQPVSVAGKVGP